MQGNRAQKYQKQLIYRHIAWMTALRHQLRLSRPWELIEDRLNKLYKPTICEDYTPKLDQELAQYLSPTGVKSYDLFGNRASPIMKFQSVRLQEMRA